MAFSPTRWRRWRRVIFARVLTVTSRSSSRGGSWSPTALPARSRARPPSINRNKESFTANVKDAADLARVRKLIARADVMIGNFRPGVLKKLGLDYESVRAINPRLVYGTITGYGNEGPWADKPGQDLLAQSLAGLARLSGDGGDNAPPVPPR